MILYILLLIHTHIISPQNQLIKTLLPFLNHLFLLILQLLLPTLMLILKLIIRLPPQLQLLQLILRINQTLQNNIRKITIRFPFLLLILIPINTHLNSLITHKHLRHIIPTFKYNKLPHHIEIRYLHKLFLNKFLE